MGEELSLADRLEEAAREADEMAQIIVDAATKSGTAGPYAGRRVRTEFSDAIREAAAILRTPDPALERLRELSEKATAGEWFDLERGVIIADGVEDFIACTDVSTDGERAELDAAFIVACVNYVRAALSPRGDGGEG